MMKRSAALLAMAMVGLMLAPVSPAGAERRAGASASAASVAGSTLAAGEPEGTLHVAYRLWRYNEQPHPDTHHATLAYQRKEPGEPWEPPRILVTAAMPDYSIFYHRLTIDRRGRLMISYDYWSTYWFYRNDHPGRRGNHRNTMFSADGGDTWQLLHTEDLR